MKKHTVASIIILIIIFSYAIVRYHIVRTTPWENFPLYISNKAISLASLVFISISYMLGSFARFIPKIFVQTLPSRKFFGLLGFGLGAMHALISAIIISPAYYARFFAQSGKLTLNGEMILAFGVLAFFTFLIVAITSLPSVAEKLDNKEWLAMQRLGYLGLVFLLLHVFILGRSGWFRPDAWQAGMMPISLLAAIVVTFTLVLKISAILFPKKENAS